MKMQPLRCRPTTVSHQHSYTYLCRHEIHVERSTSARCNLCRNFNAFRSWTYKFNIVMTKRFTAAKKYNVVLLVLSSHSIARHRWRGVHTFKLTTALGACTRTQRTVIKGKRRLAGYRTVYHSRSHPTPILTHAYIDVHADFDVVHARIRTSYVRACAVWKQL